MCAVVDTEADAVRQADATAPDLVIADIQLRQGNGVDAMERIAQCRDVPVIFVSGNHTFTPNPQIRTARFIAKPFRVESLRQAVADLSAAWPETARRWRLIRRGSTASTIHLSIFALLVIVTAASWLIYDARRNLVLEAQRTAGTAAFFLADHAARLFEASDLALLEATNAVEAMDWDRVADDKGLWERLRGLSDRLPYIDHIWLNDSSGQLRMSTIALPTPPSTAGDRDFFRAHQEPDNGLFIGELIIGRVTGNRPSC